MPITDRKRNKVKSKKVELHDIKNDIVQFLHVNGSQGLGGP